MKIGELLLNMYKSKASDLILKAGSPPLFRIYGQLNPLETPPLSVDDVEELTRSVTTERQWAQFQSDFELDLAVAVPNLCRFRVNCFRQRGNIGLVFRLIPQKVPVLDELGLPGVCKDLALKPRGLVLVTGPAGCGKSTTIASMVDYRNENEECHIVTVEDPIEFIFEDKKAIVDQREVSRDTKSFANALKWVLRQDPDVILVGEMRDLETIQNAITAAETGHLVLSTLHTIDAVQTVDRIIDVFPRYQQRQVRLQLSANLLAVISQLLLKRADGKGLVAASEVMISIAAVRHLIREAKTFQLPSILQTRTKEGMRTLNMSLIDLVKRRVITFQEALSKTPNPEEFTELMKKVRVEESAVAV